jgi:ribosomal protein S18 acetylase RimI-like enzyme
MSIEIVDLDETWQAAAVAYLRRSPYRNAIPLSNVTQLRSRCVVVLAQRDGHIQGIATHYRDLPFLGVSFVAELGAPLPALLDALADRVPALRDGELITVAPEQRAAQLANYAELLDAVTEMQMVVEPETLRPRDLPEVRRLRADELPLMTELAEAGGLGAFAPETLDNGPAYGAFVDGELAAMATTRFATTDVIEIGNIATHPDHRRKGYAAACTSALTQACFTLAPRVYLMVMTHNESAYQLYRRLGFWPSERFAFVRFRLR